MQLQYSFIIPVYNRPDEIKELLQSFQELETTLAFEIVIIEDGSTKPSKTIVNNFKNNLEITYINKKNTGPGDSRNFGMQQAKGNYFIILDSDCILPKNYLTAVNTSLEQNYVDCFGGPDTAHPTFTNLQKAINFTMTSILTTGGIRGHKNSINKFQPRSFNMGISKTAFKTSKGFGTIHPGEDPDLSIRLWNLGFKTKLIPEAFVYHKRRISITTFYKQVYKFGLVRPILNKWHPNTKKITYYFPTLFSILFLVSIILYISSCKWLLLSYVLYFVTVFIMALVTTKSIVVATLSLITMPVQFFGYGYGFIKSTFVISLLKKEPEKCFPQLFFKTT